MCLILFAHRVHPQFPLILAANRDEFLARPTLPAHLWPDSPGLLAGKDLKQGGTWLGVSTKGRWAALTNYRNPATERPNSPSRGHLTLDALQTTQPIPGYMAQLAANDTLLYSGYNLLAGNFSQIWYHGNQMQGVQEVPPGVHGLSNALLNTPWWKVEQGKSGLAALAADPQFSPQTHADAVFDLLRQPAQASEEYLPNTGIPHEWEKTLSSMFIQMENYATRCSTLLVANANGEIYFEERTWHPAENQFIHTFNINNI